MTRRSSAFHLVGLEQTLALLGKYPAPSIILDTIAPSTSETDVRSSQKSPDELVQGMLWEPPLKMDTTPLRQLLLLTVLPAYSQ